MRFILPTALGMLLFAASPLPAGDLYTGGRLFDNWYAEIDADFVPDNPDTPELDGRGGPNGNGTLPHPDTLWQLSTQSPKGFVMNTGDDAERGHRAGCARRRPALRSLPALKKAPALSSSPGRS